MEAANDPGGLIGADELPDGCEQMLPYFDYTHLPQHLQALGGHCSDLAHAMLAQCQHNDQLKTGLQKLIEAKDCFVRSKLPST